jgi:hypothetical protein
MPGLKGPEVEALYAKGIAWLRGEILQIKKKLLI